MTIDWETILDDNNSPLEDIKKDAQGVKALIEQVTHLRALAQEYHDKGDTLEKEADRICQRELPDLFMDLNIKSMDGEDYRATLQHIVSATVKDKDSAFPWLIEQGAESLIKTQVKVNLPKGHIDEAETLLKFAATLGGTGEAVQSVHAATLSKWLKERFSQGMTETPPSIDVFDANIVKFRMK